MTLSDCPNSDLINRALAALKTGHDPDTTLAYRSDDSVQHCSTMSYHAYHWHTRTGQSALLNQTLESDFLGTNLLLRHIAWRSLQRDLVPVHAAAIGANGQFWLVPAGSGKGKSVTTALALALGLEVLGDDFVLWDPSSDMLYSLYRSIRLRPDGLALLRSHFPSCAWMPLGQRDDGKHIVGPDSAHDGFHSHGRLRGILILPREHDSLSTPAELLKTFTSTFRLLQSLGVPPQGAFRHLCGLVKRAPWAQLVGHDGLLELGKALDRQCR